MSRGKVVSWLKLNLVVGLIFKVLITSYACEASAESLPMEGLKETDAIPPQFETSEFTYSNTVASTILSQVPNPITPVPPPPQPIPAPEPPPETPLDITPQHLLLHKHVLTFPEVSELLSSSLKGTRHLAI